MCNRGWPLGSLWEAVLKPLGGSFGASFGPRGGLLGPFGGLLAASWGLLGASWGLLGLSCGRKLEFVVRGPALGPILGPSWGPLEPSWALLGPCGLTGEASGRPREGSGEGGGT